MRKILIVAANATAARTFAALQGWKPQQYKIAGRAESLSGIQKLTAYLVEGWRARVDAAATVTALNQAENAGVRIVETKLEKLPEIQ